MRLGTQSLAAAASAWLDASWAFAQQIPSPPALDNPAPQQATDAMRSPLLSFFGSKTPYEFWLTGAILVCSLVFLAMAIYLLKQTTADKIEHVTRALTIILVITGTLVLVTAGYNNEQIAPAFGLFGTIVGYILGRSQTRQEEPAREDAKAKRDAG